WLPDSQGFYYMRLPMDPRIPEADRVAHATLRFHRLGTDPVIDPTIYPETGDSQLYLSPSVSMDGGWLLAYILKGWTSNDVYFKSVSASTGTFTPLFVSTSATASVTAWKGRFYIDTNEGAPHHQIFETSIDQPKRKDWKLLVPERQD